MFCLSSTQPASYLFNFSKEITPEYHFFNNNNTKMNIITVTETETNNNNSEAHISAPCSQCNGPDSSPVIYKKHKDCLKEI